MVDISRVIEVEVRIKLDDGVTAPSAQAEAAFSEVAQKISAAAASINSSLGQIGPNATKAAAAVLELGATGFAAGQRITQAVTSFDRLAAKYDDVTRATNAMAAVQREADKAALSLSQRLADQTITATELAQVEQQAGRVFDALGAKMAAAAERAVGVASGRLDAAATQAQTSQTYFAQTAQSGTSAFAIHQAQQGPQIDPVQGLPVLANQPNALTPNTPQFEQAIALQTKFLATMQLIDDKFGATGKSSAAYYAAVQAAQANYAKATLDLANSFAVATVAFDRFLNGLAAKYAPALDAAQRFQAAQRELNLLLDNSKLTASQYGDALLIEAAKTDDAAARSAAATRQQAEALRLGLFSRGGGSDGPLAPPGDPTRALQLRASSNQPNDILVPQTQPQLAGKQADFMAALAAADAGRAKYDEFAAAGQRVIAVLGEINDLVKAQQLNAEAGARASTAAINSTVETYFKLAAAIRQSQEAQTAAAASVQKYNAETSVAGSVASGVNLARAGAPQAATGLSDQEFAAARAQGEAYLAVLKQIDEQMVREGGDAETAAKLYTQATIVSSNQAAALTATIKDQRAAVEATDTAARAGLERMAASYDQASASARQLTTMQENLSALMKAGLTDADRAGSVLSSFYARQADEATKATEAQNALNASVKAYQAGLANPASIASQVNLAATGAPQSQTTLSDSQYQRVQTATAANASAQSANTSQTKDAQVQQAASITLEQQRSQTLAELSQTFAKEAADEDAAKQISVAAANARRAAIDPLFAASQKYAQQLENIAAVEAETAGFTNRANLLRAQAADEFANQTGTAKALGVQLQNTTGLANNLAFGVGGITRELIVLFHEGVITENWSRLFGSLIVITEYLGTFRDSLLTAGKLLFTTAGGLIGLATTVTVGVFAGIAASAHSAQAQLIDLGNQARATRADYLQTAEAVQAAVKSLSAGPEAVDIAGKNPSIQPTQQKTRVNANKADLTAAADIIASSSAFIGGKQEIEDLTRLANDLATVYQVTLPEAAKTFIRAGLQDPGAAAKKLADEDFTGLSATLAKEIQDQQKSGDAAGASARLFLIEAQAVQGSADRHTALGAALAGFRNALTETNAKTKEYGKSFGDSLLEPLEGFIRGLTNSLVAMRKLREEAAEPLKGFTIDSVHGLIIPTTPAAGTEAVAGPPRAPTQLSVVGTRPSTSAATGTFAELDRQTALLFEKFPSLFTPKAEGQIVNRDRTVGLPEGDRGIGVLQQTPNTATARLGPIGPAYVAENAGQALVSGLAQMNDLYQRFKTQIEGGDLTGLTKSFIGAKDTPKGQAALAGRLSVISNFTDADKAKLPTDEVGAVNAIADIYSWPPIMRRVALATVKAESRGFQFVGGDTRPTPEQQAAVAGPPLAPQTSATYKQELSSAQSLTANLPGSLQRDTLLSLQRGFELARKDAPAASQDYAVFTRAIESLNAALLNAKTPLEKLNDEQRKTAEVNTQSTGAVRTYAEAEQQKRQAVVDSGKGEATAADLAETRANVQQQLNAKFDDAQTAINRQTAALDRQTDAVGRNTAASDVAVTATEHAANQEKARAEVVNSALPGSLEETRQINLRTAAYDRETEAAKANKAIQANIPVRQQELTGQLQTLQTRQAATDPGTDTYERQRIQIEAVSGELYNLRTATQELNHVQELATNIQKADTGAAQQLAQAGQQASEAARKEGRASQAAAEETEAKRLKQVELDAQFENTIKAVDRHTTALVAEGAATVGSQRLSDVVVTSLEHETNARKAAETVRAYALDNSVREQQEVKRLTESYDKETQAEKLATTAAGTTPARQEKLKADIGSIQSLLESTPKGSPAYALLQRDLEALSGTLYTTRTQVEQTNHAIELTTQVAQAGSRADATLAAAQQQGAEAAKNDGDAQNSVARGLETRRLKQVELDAQAANTLREAKEATQHREEANAGTRRGVEAYGSLAVAQEHESNVAAAREKVRDTAALNSAKEAQEIDALSGEYDRLSQATRAGALYGDLDAQKQAIALLQDQVAVVGQSAPVQDVYIAQVKAIQELRAKGFTAQIDETNQYVAQATQIAKLTDQLNFYKTSLSDLGNALTSAFDQLGQSISNAFVSGTGAAVNFHNAIKSLLGSLLTELTKLALINPLENAIGLGPTKGTLFGAFDALAQTAGQQNGPQQAGAVIPSSAAVAILQAVANNNGASAGNIATGALGTVGANRGVSGIGTVASAGLGAAGGASNDNAQGASVSIAQVLGGAAANDNTQGSTLSIVSAVGGGGTSGVPTFVAGQEGFVDNGRFDVGNGGGQQGFVDNGSFDVGNGVGPTSSGGGGQVQIVNIPQSQGGGIALVPGGATRSGGGIFSTLSNLSTGVSLLDKLGLTNIGGSASSFASKLGLDSILGHFGFGSPTPGVAGGLNTAGTGIEGFVGNILDTPVFGGLSTEAAAQAATTGVEGAAGPVLDAAGAASTGATTVGQILGPAGIGFAGGSLLGGFIQSSLGKTGPGPEIGAGVGVAGGVAVGAIADAVGLALAPETFGLSLIIGGLLGGAAGGLIGPKPPSPFSSTEVGVTDSGQLDLGRSVSQLINTDADRAAANAAIQQTNVILANNALRITDDVGVNAPGRALSVSPGDAFSFQIGQNSPNGPIDPSKFADFNSAFAALRFGPSDPGAVSANFFRGRSFASPDELDAVTQAVNKFIAALSTSPGKDATASFLAEQGSLPNANVPQKLSDITTFVTQTVPQLTGSGSLASQIEQLNEQFTPAIETAQQLGYAEDQLVAARDRAIKKANDTAQFTLSQTDIGLNARLDTAHTAVTQGAGTPGALAAQESTALYTFDNATGPTQEKQLADQLTATFGDAYATTADYAAHIALLEKTLGEERLAIVQGFTDQITAASANQQFVLEQSTAGLNVRYQTAETAITTTPGSPEAINQQQSTALYNFDQVTAVAQRKQLSDQLVATFGDAYKTSADYAAQLALLEKTLGAERLAISQGFTDQITAQTKSAQNSVIGVVDSLTSYSRSLEASTLSPLQQYKLASQEFTQQNTKAQGGDFQAITNLQNYASTFVGASRAIYGSGSQYFADVQSVLDAINSIAATPPETLTADAFRLIQQQALQVQTTALQTSLSQLGDLLNMIYTALNVSPLMPGRLAH